MFLSIACVGSFPQFRQNFTEEKVRYSTLPLVGHFPEDFKLTSSMISVFDEHVPPCTDNSNCKNSSGPPCHPRCDPTLQQPATVPTTDNNCHVAMCPHSHHQDPSANLGRLLHRRAPTPTPSRLTYPGHQRTRNILLPFHLSGRRRPTTSAATPGTGPAAWVPCHAHSPHSANPPAANDKRHCAPCHAQPTLPRKSIHCQHSPVCQVARFSAPSSAGMGSEWAWAWVQFFYPCLHTTRSKWSILFKSEWTLDRPIDRPRTKPFDPGPQVSGLRARARFDQLSDRTQGIGSGPESHWPSEPGLNWTMVCLFCHKRRSLRRVDVRLRVIVWSVQSEHY